MDEIPLPTPPPQAAIPAATPGAVPAYFGSQICPRCHFPARPEWYYCPNCGAKLTEPPIGTGLIDQLLLYAFSIILPWIAYLAITKWQGIKYLRSPDRNAKQIGLIALILLIASSVVAFWLTYVWIQGYIQSSLNDVNNLGNGLGGGL
ncbi:MAG TPA: zinc ribbon domain-containing protein [Candidatus Paceibacterota bacterium]|nr:zinc ribbon domain-containing protein [Candidatus Paceibacterota bacterium]